MIDRVGDGSSSADDADLADTLHPKGIEMRLHLVDEDHVDVMDIGIHRHMILGEIVIDETAIAVVDHGLFMQRHADTADHGAHDLAVRSWH